MADVLDAAAAAAAATAASVSPATAAAAVPSEELPELQIQAVSGISASGSEHPIGAEGDGGSDVNAAGSLSASSSAVVVPPPDPSLPPPKRVLVIGDENLLFTSGMQEAYPDIEFTVTTILSRSNLEAYGFDPIPQILRGRVRHMVDPCRIGKNFQQAGFDEIMLFLPGLGFAVPRELASADRPLFAYRTHLLAFHILRHSKLVLKGDGHVHLVWPDDQRFISSPCGAAGIEMQQLMHFCGCKPVEAMYVMEKVRADYFFPFILGEVPAELPEWLSGSRIHSFTIDREPIAIPLAVALLLHPDVGFVTIKDASPDGPEPPQPGQAVPLRAALIHEATVRREKLKEAYSAKENAENPPDILSIVPETNEEDAILAVPSEIFSTSFDDLPHLSMVLVKYQICEEQAQMSIASLDVLDPRLPTRIARPPPNKTPNPITAAVMSQQGKKRQRSQQDEWGAMKFCCTLTKICTPTAEKMRLHMQGDLYKRLAASSPDWDESTEKKDLLAELEEEEAQVKRSRTQGQSQKVGGNNDDGGGKGRKGGGKGKGGKGKGGKGRRDRD
eukprot:CAMPEP_0206420728 /NCGR_PEP_ID=MMETSP0324_2-20121206/1028_1 /ASSEMBLY_ACC=CAM_ASM_000836 /TAXON_ID=2866 /ORGANISM="Crypthecodinium cohnii, Strain Seligo" /LENGTH=557 /DNA_ID=CAMNT_0053884693 /DNA_START=115 /DNA_END=1787 /DNA_ORIENTATION=+